MKFADTATRTITTNAAASVASSDTTRYAILSESFLHNRKIIGGRAFLVLWALLTFRNAGTGLAWPSVQTIADLLGIDDRGVQRGLAKLLELGIIEWTGRTTTHGVKYYLVHLAMPGATVPCIINSRVEPTYMATGGVVSRTTGGVVSRTTQNIEDEHPKEQQPQTPSNGGKPDGVVVLSPAAPTAKATASLTPQPPQAAPPTQSPITQPTQANADTTQYRPTVGIRNGATIQSAKPILPAKVETAVQPPLPKEPEHPPAFHHSLTRAESAAVMTILAILPSDLQAIVLAEFLCKLDEGGIHRPVGYARRLVEVAKSGTFVPSAGRESAKEAEYAAIREKQEKEEEEKNRIKAENTLADASKLATAMEAVGQEKIAQLRGEFIIHLKKTNKMAHDLYQQVGFNSVGFGKLFRGYLTRELFPVPS